MQQEAGRILCMTDEIMANAVSQAVRGDNSVQHGTSPTGEPEVKYI